MAKSDKASSTVRLEALSDGVFAVAMTLVVLDIRVPSVGLDRLPAALVSLVPHLLGFVLSFFIVTFYWGACHVLFNAFHRSNRLLLWFNAIHLLTVVLLPFSTGLLAAYTAVRFQSSSTG